MSLTTLDRTRHQFPAPIVPPLAKKNVPGVLRYFLFDCRLRPAYLVCWMLILYYSQKEGYAYFGKTRIRTLLGVSRRRTDEILQWLTGAKFLECAFDMESLRDRFYLLKPYDGQRISKDIVKKLAKAVGFLSPHIAPSPDSKPLPMHLRAFLARLGTIARHTGDQGATIAEIVRTGVYRERVCHTNLRDLLKSDVITRRLVKGEAVYSVKIPEKGAADRQSQANTGAADFLYKYKTDYNSKYKNTPETISQAKLISRDKSNISEQPDNGNNDGDNNGNKGGGNSGDASPGKALTTDNGGDSSPPTSAPPLLSAQPCDVAAVCRDFWVYNIHPQKERDGHRRGGGKVSIRIVRHPTLDSSGSLAGAFEIAFLKYSRNRWQQLNYAKNSPNLVIDASKLAWLRDRVVSHGGGIQEVVICVLVAIFENRTYLFKCRKEIRDMERYLTSVIVRELNRSNLNSYLELFTQPEYYS